METPEEQKLIVRVQDGDLAAYQILVKTYQESVVRIAFRFSNNFHSAQDISQDVFLRAFEKIGQYDEEKGAFSSWLFQITKRLALNSKRKATPELVSFLGDEKSTADSPAKIADRRDLFEALDSALLDLEEPFRSAFILAEIEGLPLRVVAEIEKAPEGTIKSRIHRAKLLLRKSLPSEIKGTP